MGILSELLRIVMHLSCVAIDMAILLLLFRILGQWRRIEWVQRINGAAKSVVDPLCTAVGRGWRPLTSVPLAEKHILALSVLTLCLARSLLQIMAGILL